MLSLNSSAKSALFALIVGGVILLGGIPYQIVIGMSMASVTGETERFGYLLMSRGSLILTVGYTLVFFAGLAFWRLGPFKLRRDRWFLGAFLAFYIWFPLDWYFIACDLRFAIGFNPALPLTEELTWLFTHRQMFMPLPLVIQLCYLVAIALIVFQPRLGQIGS